MYIHVHYIIHTKLYYANLCIYMYSQVLTSTMRKYAWWEINYLSCLHIDYLPGTCTCT